MFITILKEEILLNLQNRAKLIHNLLFFCISFAVFFLTSSAFSAQIPLQIALIYNSWFCLLFNILFIGSDFLKEDYEDGVLEQMLIKFSNFEIFVLAKIISNWLIFCLPILMMIFIFSLLFGIETHFVKKLFLLLSIASLAIIFITSFSGCLNLLSGKTSLIAIIVMPLILPILLISFRAIADFSDVENFYLSLKLLIGSVILSMTFSCFFTAKIIKIAYE